MKLEKKIALAARTLDVGKNRIILNTNRLSEIKDAITRQDIRDMVSDNAISVRPIKGRRKVKRRALRRRIGSIKKKTANKKRKYILLTRKLRKYLGELKRKNLVTRDSYYQLRQEIRASRFRSKSHMKEHLAQLKK